jgi:hypothetical protein
VQAYPRLSLVVGPGKNLWPDQIRKGVGKISRQWEAGMIAMPKYFFHQDADVRSEMIRNHLQEELGMPVTIWSTYSSCKMINGKNTDSPK